MKFLGSALSTLSILFFQVGLSAGECNPHPPVSESFSHFRSLLEGSWKGHNEATHKDDNLEVTYESTAGGTALVERLFPGTDHEMLSVYHPEKGHIAMTHYCLMGNQPHLVMKKSVENHYNFEFVPTTGINPKKDAYMGKLSVSLSGNDSLTQEWTSYSGGKPKDTSVFVFKKQVKKKG